MMISTLVNKEKKKLLFCASTFKMKSMKMVVLLTLALIMMSGCKKDKKNELFTVPTASSAVGYNKLSFNDEFNSLSTIDVNATKQAGYNWYIDPPIWSSVNAPPSSYSVSNGVLTLSSDLAGLYSYSSHGDLGNSFHYGYFEARMRFDPASGASSNGWPAFWSLSTKHCVHNNLDIWSELDFFEAYTGGHSAFGDVFVGTLHEWGWSGGVNIHYQNSNNFAANTVDSQWHTYGCLWVPGKVTWYFDGGPLMTQNYSATAPPDPLPNAGAGSPTPPSAGTFMNIDDDLEGMTIFLGTGSDWPLEVDWVRVWQAK